MLDDTFEVTIEPATVHEAPSITRLGTLTELTRGGSVGIDDGLGGAGDEGSL